MIPKTVRDELIAHFVEMSQKQGEELLKMWAESFASADWQDHGTVSGGWTSLVPATQTLPRNRHIDPQAPVRQALRDVADSVWRRGGESMSITLPEGVTIDRTKLPRHDCSSRTCPMIGFGIQHSHTCKEHK